MLSEAAAQVINCWQAAGDPKRSVRDEVTKEVIYVNQWTGVLGVAALIVGLVFLLRRTAKSQEQELCRLCRGDREMMERLISHEERKMKGRSRKTAMRAAIDSLKRDNH